MPPASGVAIFGGTFDPVHFGHLRSALEVREALGVRAVRFVPSYIPPHRDAPQTTPAHRLEMLRLAIRGAPGFEIDERELMREGKSYAVDTLRSIREEVGTQVPLTTVIGFDAYRLLYQWYEWQHLLDYAHIAVLARPGYGDADLTEEMLEFTNTRLVAEPSCLATRACGSICRLKLTQIGISATAVRRVIAAGKSPAYMLPSDVISYIDENGLYEAAS